MLIRIEMCMMHLRKIIEILPNFDYCSNILKFLSMKYLVTPFSKSVYLIRF